MNLLSILGRTEGLFTKDLIAYENEISQIIRNSSFLVIGGGGSIGQAVSKELFSRNAGLLHIVDLNENYLVELVRDIRSSLGYRTKNFETFAIDCGALEFEQFFSRHRYDFVLNLSAMKHVRSENDAFSMLRMIKVNIFNTLKTYELSENTGAQKYFCVSTDKAANPVNFMGATKRAMEIALMRTSNSLPMSGARFANVAFSNGSLLNGFEYRLKKQQPFSAPSDVSRFFLTAQEAGVICLFSAILGEKYEILFPFNSVEMSLRNFVDIAKQYLRSVGKEGVECTSEDEARDLIKVIDLEKFWPINVFMTDTIGEKPFEEFYTNSEEVHHGKFKELASVYFQSDVTNIKIDTFKRNVESINLTSPHAKSQFVELLTDFVPSFQHLYSPKSLNMRM